MSYPEVRNYVQRLVGEHGGPAPIAGSPTWCALSDDNPAKLLAVLHCGTRWVLEEAMASIDERRLAEKAAAVEVSQAADWARVGSEIRRRDEWLRTHPWAKREVSA
ncbi:DUF2742 domain-containing protein [Gordonia tangerina]|uniref:DUF2742 domain-containing protein n=1 Tax=Gordonia tangerina TaxID=2911060 RepID=A0ABS9DIL5_9ACTN|nr:DUF2742 domain-containing protein [Gordonia tangerina]MCF3939070.1 DUF2742 domain-containing protein [Gordonia tangerina]